ncbi:hypothetical protein BX666DRAFT_1500562 [Dichotomocladium elegans]|nr:hypothetical protein BX666DRAFT_1500562 [Dichotomocladium elegans]
MDICLPSPPPSPLSARAGPEPMDLCPRHRRRRRSFSLLGLVPSLWIYAPLRHWLIPLLLCRLLLRFRRPLLFFRRCLLFFCLRPFRSLYLPLLPLLLRLLRFLPPLRSLSQCLHPFSILRLLPLLLPYHPILPSLLRLRLLLPLRPRPTCLPPPSATKACRVMCLPSIPYRFRSCRLPLLPSPYPLSFLSAPCSASSCSAILFFLFSASSALWWLPESGAVSSSL